MFKKAFLFCLISLLIFPIVSYAKGKAKGKIISWDPPRIEETMGQGWIKDLEVTFTSSENLNGVNLRIVPELEPFISVEPDYFPVIKANQPNQVMLTLSIPPDVKVGSYDGTVHLKVGKRTYPQTLKVNLNIIEEVSLIPSTTKPLSQDTTRFLESIAPDGSILLFSETTPELDSLVPGDSIVIGVTPLTPYGMLREIVDISMVNGKIEVETIPTTLEDVIEEGSIVLSKILTPDDILPSATLRSGAFLSEKVHVDFGEFYLEINNIVLYDKDGNDKTKDDQIKANGSIRFKPSFDFSLQIKWFTLKKLAFVNNVIETAELKIVSEIEIAGFEKKKYEIYRQPFTPITIPIGPVPVVIIPVLTVNVGADGSVSVGIETGVKQEATLSAGLSYKDGSWEVINDFSNEFEFIIPTIYADASLKGYAGPQLSLLIYGITGPYAEINGFLELGGELSFTPPCLWELSADLYGGLEAGVGVRVEVLSKKITDYYVPAVIGYRLPLWGWSYSPPDTDGDCVLDIVDNCPEVPNFLQSDIDMDGIGDACDADADGDSYEGDLGTGEDCDDNDAAINPGIEELCDDEIDNDCNGLTDCDDPDCDSDPACSGSDDCFITFEDIAIGQLPAGWITDNDGWFVTDEEAYSGTKALRALHNQGGSVSFTATTEDGEISFNFKPGYDAYGQFAFYIDDELIEQWPESNSWSYFSHPISAGTHTFKWYGGYEPKFVTSYIDNVTLPCGTTVDPEICDDTVDNDGDGLIDCDDPDCPNIISTLGGTPPGRITIISGSLNGEVIGSGSTVVTVPSGSTISGTIGVRVENWHRPGAVFPVGWTPTWGDHALSYRSVTSHIHGTRDYTISVNLTTPATPGDYYIFFAGAWQIGVHMLMSATSWAYFSSPIWDDCNDVADWGESNYQLADSNGWCSYDVLNNDGYYRTHAPGAGIKLIVE